MNKINKTPKISIVIPTKNRFHDIIKCIESILIQTLLPAEIVIVDASDTQELKLKIKEFKSEKTKIIYINAKPGVNYQRNIGIKNSCGDIVFILDDDTILEKDFIKEIVNVFENDEEKKIGGVCGDIININENRSVIYSILAAIYRTTFANVFFLPKIGNGKFQLSGFPTYLYTTNEIKNVECLPSGLTAFRREVLNEFIWDENLHYMTDDDFSYRISRKYQNVYTPYAKLIHNVSPIAREGLYMKRKMIVQNHYYLFKKNLPQTIKHKFAFCMSIIGLLIIEMMGAIMKKNTDGLRGLIKGLIDIK